MVRIHSALLQRCWFVFSMLPAAPNGSFAQVPETLEERAKWAREALDIDTINKHFDFAPETWKACMAQEIGRRSLCLMSVLHDEETKPEIVAEVPFEPGAAMIRGMIEEAQGITVATDAWSRCRRNSPPPEESEVFADCMRGIAESLKIDVRSDRKRCEDEIADADPPKLPADALERCVALVSLQRVLLNER